MTSDSIFRTAVALLVTALAIWSNRRRATARAAVRPPAPVREDPMEAERTRRVQEDIRRKIAQRAARAAPPVIAAAGSEPSAPPPSLAMAPPPPADQPLFAAPPSFAAPVSPIEASPFRRDPAPAAAPPRRDWLAELRERQGARRAIVLREILGPPVGLR